MEIMILTLYLITMLVRAKDMAYKPMSKREIQEYRNWAKTLFVTEDDLK